MRNILAILLLSFVTACADQIHAANVEPDMSTLEGLLAAEKFAANELYTGPDLPEDGPQLIALVDATVADLMAMSTPREATLVKARLEKLITDVDLFATEDREQAYRYAVLAWRAAGFDSESGLFSVPDSFVLSERL